MRSLAIASTRFWDIPFAQTNATVFDVENNCAYVLSENDGIVELFRLPSSGSEDVRNTFIVINLGQ